jgi:hypothetical protein
MDTSAHIAGRTSNEHNMTSHAAAPSENTTGGDACSSVAQELVKLEKTCKRAVADLTGSRNVRETLAFAQVDVPHHLKAIAGARLPTLGRLARLTDIRVEEVVHHQLERLSREQNEYVASREFDQLKATDWPYLRDNNPDLYWKALKQANLILERKR